jgi:hypothetical protein
LLLQKDSYETQVTTYARHLRSYIQRDSKVFRAFDVGFAHTREVHDLHSPAAAFEDEADRRILFLMLG